ncbi:excinuclease ABC subunit B [Roseicyclus persicicus]|uniref:Excinuclease ABC subunit B n=1 Tax=Roseicyclus persicicus TaxID=2650661 RepID=A0A7X6JXY0_9RHOB|nr:excinuclease ABC subunit B [Roseibacterium persicicum]NKX43243.1 excinuclease ABC subunit B [Roseibacterium persicicum]
MRRLALLAALVAAAGPAAAWQAGVEGALCTLTHSDPAAGEVRLTYDPSLPVYSITVTRPEPWPAVPRFEIAFLGGAELTIGTDRHSLSDDGLSLTVTDRGFGNVLNGLSGNLVAAMLAGDVAVPFSLAGAAPEVAAFEACTAAPSA